MTRPSHLLLATVAFCLFTLLAGASIMLPGSVLEAAGYSSEPAAVTGYLRAGLPRDAVPREKNYYYASPFNRWELYGYCCGVLGSASYPEAVPVLVERLTGPLPEPLLEDLLMKAATEYSWDEADWSDWDDRVDSSLRSFYGACSSALQLTDLEAAGKALLPLVQREKDAAKAAMQDGAAWFSRVHRYATICTVVARSGRKEGIDALVELLPYAKGVDGANLAMMVKYHSGTPVPLEDKPSDEQLAEFARKVQEWWSANRETWTPPKPPKHVETQPEKDLPLKTVRDYVFAATQKRWFSFDAVGEACPEAHEWLKNNGAKHGRALRKLADDVNEDMEVRVMAAQYYVQAGGDKAMSWLGRTLLLPADTNPPMEQRIEPRRIFFSNIQGQVDMTRVARECVEEQSPCAEEAANYLLHRRRPGTNVFLLKHYDGLVKRYPRLRLLIVQFYRDVPTPGEEKVFADCLVNGERMTAVFAAAAIRARGIEASLDDAARAALQRWRENPVFRLSVVSHLEDVVTRKAEAAEIARGVTGDTAQAAQAYTHAYALITNHFAEPVTPEAQFCLDGLRRCIAAYRAQRGDFQ